MEELKIAIEASIEAGKEIMKIYETDNFQVENKEDESPLTIADKAANDIINSYLNPTGIPVISEENKQLPFSERKNWSKCWIVDPLDGTKEFIKRNGEFTVNIALIEKGKPQLGVIYAPALKTLYFGDVREKKAYKVQVGEEFSMGEIFKGAEEIFPKKWKDQINVVGSRSHMNEDTQNFMKNLEQEYNCTVNIVSKGSSLKFCLVAEGEANIYPRFAPTMEWDTAAGQAICEAVGLKVALRKNNQPISYNREDLLNEHFLVSYEG